MSAGFDRRFIYFQKTFMLLKNIQQKKDLIMPRETVLDEFVNLCAVPRRSYHNEKAIAYSINWAKKHGFEYFYDELNDNVLIRKPAAKGCEDKPGICLQGHLDMVAAADPGIQHDWENEGIKLIRNGDWLSADGTTLGADDGVALALSFALFTDESLKNPPLEILLTTNEEVGMDSVKNADLSYLKSKYLYNLDSGPEGFFTIGCCGGATLEALIPNETETAKGNIYTLTVCGLKGGHSGVDIHFERANAINLTGKILYSLGKRADIRICSIDAAGKDNVINKRCVCTFASDAPLDEINDVINEQQSALGNIFRMTDPDIGLVLEKADADKMLTKRSSDMLRFLLHELPFGLLHMEQNLDGAETSANIGIAETRQDHIVLTLSVRSSVEERTVETIDKIRGLCEISGAKLSDTDKSYPAWLPDFDSPLIDIIHDVYFDMYKKEPEIHTVHGGLECGYIMKNSNIEAAIAMGPDSIDYHTTGERLSISSLERTYDFLKAAVEAV